MDERAHSGAKTRLARHKHRVTESAQNGHEAKFIGRLRRYRPARRPTSVTPSHRIPWGSSASCSTYPTGRREAQLFAGDGSCMQAREQELHNADAWALIQYGQRHRPLAGRCEAHDSLASCDYSGTLFAGMQPVRRPADPLLTHSLHPPLPGRRSQNEQRARVPTF